MVIVGIDPGLNATGYGIISSEAGRLRLVAAGTVTPAANQPLSRRLHDLHQGVTQVLTQYHPDLASFEALYTHHQFMTTAAIMAHARGVVCLAAAQQGLSIVEYLPTRVKKALTGHGAASKQQVARAVGTWLGVRVEAWPSDATDALALAIAHAHISGSPLARITDQPVALSSRRELLAVVGGNVGLKRMRRG